MLGSRCRGPLSTRFPVLNDMAEKKENSLFNKWKLMFLRFIYDNMTTLMNKSLDMAMNQAR